MRFVRLVFLFLFATSSTLLARAETPVPVNPHASPEARALLAYLYSISGHATITGQHSFTRDGSKWSDLAYQITGKYPGLFGADLGFAGGDDKNSILARPALIEEIKRQYQLGTVIALNWHAVRPTQDEPVVFEKSVLGHIDDQQWQDLLTPGTPLYQRWCGQVDVVAAYLAQLRDAHIPVLFRPYHEINGNWFWWGYRPGPDGSAALYRQLYHRLVDVHHLNNLLWVWNVGAPGRATDAPGDYFPGDDYVDIVSFDNYREFSQADYDGLLEIAKGKPIALAEVGNVPSPQVLAQQPRWVYFMVWSGSLEKNPKGLAKEVFDLPQVLNRGDPRLAAPLEAIRKAAPGEVTSGAAALQR